MCLFARIHSFTQAGISEFVIVDGLPSRTMSSICIRSFSNMLYHLAIVWPDIAFSPYASFTALIYNLGSTFQCRDMLMTDYQKNTNTILKAAASHDKNKCVNCHHTVS
ncbi:hypothetical protein NPIL_203511 [Nephila pilipes]|uniref:Uncharacterized protein n=1 Tax=Nephila pilipes TaxID=299642 RepID=A0A8X6UBH8_NEPPI|nr:hypothetical protein NPIL_203511 [Nephila pilipes]